MVRLTSFVAPDLPCNRVCNLIPASAYTRRDMQGVERLSLNNPEVRTEHEVYIQIRVAYRETLSSCIRGCELPEFCFPGELHVKVVTLRAMSQT